MPEFLEPKNAVNCRIRLNACSDKELIDTLYNLIQDFELYGVRGFVSSNCGIVEIERREITEEEYYKELHEACAAMRERREAAK